MIARLNAPLAVVIVTLTLITSAGTPRDGIHDAFAQGGTHHGRAQHRQVQREKATKTTNAKVVARGTPVAK